MNFSGLRLAPKFEPVSSAGEGSSIIFGILLITGGTRSGTCFCCIGNGVLGTLRCFRQKKTPPRIPAKRSKPSATMIMSGFLFSSIKK